ncbi:HAL/PAL/TAL family ammonia-lyase [Comamonas sp. C24C]
MNSLCCFLPRVPLRTLTLAVLASLNLQVHAAVELNGRNATPDVITRITLGERVQVAPAAMARVKKAHEVLMAAAAAGQKIYGLTVGVGQNKDRDMVDAHGQLSPEVIKASQEFNIGLLHAHAGGVGPDAPVQDVRAAMAARLNALLDGGAGVQASIVEAYVQFLNHGITPAMPALGSIGEADITLLSHVGTAMMGEGDVYYQGRKQPAAEVLRQLNIRPIEPVGKDALSILSSNAYASGMAALALQDMAHFNRISQLVFALSLQALNGNVSPFLKDSLALHPFPQTQKAGEDLRHLLDGSSLWNADDKRALQDPLSFRTGVYLLGEQALALEQASAQLAVQLNSSDDNPGVAVGAKPASDRAQEKRAYVEGLGAVLPDANFEPLPWVLAMEKSGLSLAHSALASAQRVVKLNDPAFTGLSRFLGTEYSVHAFGAMEKPVMALAMQSLRLAQPASMNYLPVAGNIEDVATNAPIVAQNFRQQIQTGYQLLGVELVHAAQAIDLRRTKDPNFRLSPATAELFDALRNQVAFLDKDRALTLDFRAAAELLRTFR